ncbi:MAG: hypothetical protein KAI43_03280 [Candidatus Aureabacteria bacterium]|nr:hypothetical protein [Candidatus Auribacterota bacterium]
MSLGQVQGIKSFYGHFWIGLAGLLISPARGILVFSPIFIFSFIYLFYILFTKKHDPIFKYLAVSVILLIILYAKWGMWWGGWTFGYRLLIELIPPLILFLALFWEDLIEKKLYLKRIFFVSLLLSIYIHSLGAFIYPSDFNYAPNNIDQHQERLWYIFDTEITRCTLRFFKQLL